MIDKKDIPEATRKLREEAKKAQLLGNPIWYLLEQIANHLEGK